MNKKKIAALLIAGILTVGVVGGTFAWFTSSDSVTNQFSTGAVTDPETPGNPDAGIEIEENFPDDKDKDGKYDNPVLPGTTMTKEVSVKSTANYDQYLRAKVTKTWYYNGKVVTHYKLNTDGTVLYGVPETGENINTGENPNTTSWSLLNTTFIELKFAATGEPKTDTWSPLAKDGFYYYNQLLGKSPAETSDLLETVIFSSLANNYYKNLTFDVKIDAEGVQATQDAISDWSAIPEDVKELGK